MPQNIIIEIRNIDVGPLKDGNFFHQQTKTTQRQGIGDGLFGAPASAVLDPDSQFGFEKLITPVVVIRYKDKTVQAVENIKQALPMPGQALTVNIDLLKHSSGDIEAIELDLKAPCFGHSRSGGNGMSSIKYEKIGTPATYRWTTNHFDNKLVASASLSDHWDPNLNKEDKESGRNELIAINFLKTPKQINNDVWQRVELIDNWRSALAPYWVRNTGNEGDYKLHKFALWTIPIKLFAPGEDGWVIGINEGSQLTEEMSQHQRLYKHHRTTPEFQQGEEEMCSNDPIVKM